MGETWVRIAAIIGDKEEGAQTEGDAEVAADVVRDNAAALGSTTSKSSQEILFQTELQQYNVAIIYQV